MGDIYKTPKDEYYYRNSKKDEHDVKMKLYVGSDKTNVEELFKKKLLYADEFANDIKRREIKAQVKSDRYTPEEQKGDFQINYNKRLEKLIKGKHTLSKLTVMIPTSLHNKLKKEAIDNNKKIREIIIELINNL